MGTGQSVDSESMAFVHESRGAEYGSPQGVIDTTSGSKETDRTLTPYAEGEPSKAQLKRATRTRKIFALLSSFCLLVSIVFLVLVEIGQTYIKPVLTDIFFIKLDLSHIVPATVPNAFLINDIAQTLGLHDFYQVGLWSFCEGYNSGGVTYCSPPKSLFWFNPVEILTNELLAGATRKLPPFTRTSTTVLISLLSRTSSQHQHRSRPHQDCLAMDVRSFLCRTLPRIYNAVSCPFVSLLSMGYATHRTLHLTRCSGYDRGRRSRNRHVCCTKNSYH